jgi:hypothetical protein
LCQVSLTELKHACQRFGAASGIMVNACLPQIAERVSPGFTSADGRAPAKGLLLPIPGF